MRNKLNNIAKQTTTNRRKQAKNATKTPQYLAPQIFTALQNNPKKSKNATNQVKNATKFVKAIIVSNFYIFAYYCL